METRLTPSELMAAHSALAQVRRRNYLIPSHAIRRSIHDEDEEIEAIVKAVDQERAKRTSQAA